MAPKFTPVAMFAIVAVFGALTSSCDRAGVAKEQTVELPAIRYEDHVWAGGVPPPAGELRNPHAGDADGAKNGERLFASMSCDGCHGGSGSGWVGPSLSDGRWRYG